MTKVWTMIKILVAVPGAFVRINLIENAFHVRTPAHTVEYKKFRLGAKICCVGDTRRSEIVFGLLTDASRILFIPLVLSRIVDAAANGDSRLL